MSLISAVVLLGILIFVHELGHFIFAKKLGVKVLKFSLGFGPKLISRKYGDTEYILSSIPLGGYVKPLGEDPDEKLSEEEKPVAFNYQPVWKRSLIILSGPVFNIIFAALIFFIIMSLLGVPVIRPVAGKVADDSPAGKSGLTSGARIVEINGNSIQSWDEIDMAVDKSSGKELIFKAVQNAKTIEFAIQPVRKKEKNIFGEETFTWDIGISPFISSEIGEVVKGSRADKANLKKGDWIIEIEGKPVDVWQDLTAIIHENPERPLKFKIKRGDITEDLSITPEKQVFKVPNGQEKKIGLIGIKPVRNDFTRKFGIAKSMLLAVEKTYNIIVLTILSFVKLFQRVIPADTIGGPIMIFQMAGQQAEQGMLSFLTFMAIISINLGVLNLLPVPVLDGGHLMFLIIEKIRKKPLSEKVIIVAQKIGIALLVTLMAFAFYNDIMRLITGRTFS